MSIVIREADLVQDEEVLIHTLNQNRNQERGTDKQRYHWRYLENPHGQAKAWLAVDDRNGNIAGFTVVHPRLMDVDGEEMVCWNCGDFSINTRYRTLGAAIKLRSAATQCVNRGEVPFLYAHPNDRMMLVHLKTGHKVIGQMVRYARVLRFERYLPEWIQNSWLSEGLAWAYNKGFVKWKAPSRSRAYHSEIADTFPSGATFDSLQEQVRRKWKIFGLRSHDYLQWRFGANPLLQVSTLLLYRGGELVGYAFYSCEAHIMYIHDLFCLPEQKVSDTLVAHITEAGFAQKAQAVSVTLFESNPLIRAFQNHDYKLRPNTSSVIVHTSPGIHQGSILQNKAHWFMTVGDRDV